MSSKRSSRIRSAVLAAIVAVCAPTAQARDWGKHPAIVQVDTKQDVYVVGDAHGDPGHLSNALLAAGLIGAVPSDPSQAKWAAGKSVMVMTGDMIDKGPNSLGVIALLRALQDDAAKHGGQVIILMGNHEGEFLADPGGDKTSEFQKELQASGQKASDVGACRGDLGTFLCDLPIGARVNSWFFSHGGNTGRQSVDQLERAIEAGVDQSGFKAEVLSDPNSILEARLNKKGPGDLPWIYNGDAKSDPKTLLAGYASALGVKHLVQGHQYDKLDFPDGHNRAEYQFFQRYGLLFLIDSGMSQGISNGVSTGGVVRIKDDDKAELTCANGDKVELWDSKTKQDFAGELCGPTP